MIFKFMAAAFIFLSGGLHAETHEPSPQWFKCTADADCINLEFDCAGGVINKKFMEAASAYYRQQAMVMNCAAAAKDESAPALRAVCTRGKCEIKPATKTKR